MLTPIQAVRLTLADYHRLVIYGFAQLVGAEFLFLDPPFSPTGRNRSSIPFTALHGKTSG
jgi:hypothetical protein